MLVSCETLTVAFLVNFRLRYDTLIVSRVLCAANSAVKDTILGGMSADVLLYFGSRKFSVLIL